MIRGIGFDLVEIDRIARAMATERFAECILTPAERQTNVSHEYAAGRWAAKEAVAKAVATHLLWQEVSILGDDKGKPIVVFHREPPDGCVHVSISHERGIAAAVAVWEVS